MFIEPLYGFNQTFVHDLVIVYDPTFGATGQVRMSVNGTRIHNQTLTAKGTDKLYLNTWFSRSTYYADHCPSIDIFSLKVLQ